MATHCDVGIVTRAGTVHALEIVDSNEDKESVRARMSVDNDL